MDQIHEELKQPVGTFHPPDNGCLDKDSACVENGNESQDEMADEAVIETSQKNQVGSGSVDPSNIQSDTEYETCDSGLSSERSSVEHNMSSGDEGMENGGDSQNWSETQKDGKEAEVNQTGSRPRRSKRDKNRVNPQENGDEAEEVKNPKAAKENANLAHKQQKSGPQPGDTLPKEGEVDLGEFSDAVSEMEPLQSERSRADANLSVHLPRGQKSRSRPTSESEVSRHGAEHAQNGG